MKNKKDILPFHATRQLETTINHYINSIIGCPKDPNIAYAFLEKLLEMQEDGMRNPATIDEIQKIASQIPEKEPGTIVKYLKSLISISKGDKNHTLFEDLIEDDELIPIELLQKEAQKVISESINRNIEIFQKIKHNYLIASESEVFIKEINKITSHKKDSKQSGSSHTKDGLEEIQKEILGQHTEKAIEGSKKVMEGRLP